MGVSYDFSDVDNAIKTLQGEVRALFESEGEKAVEYAVEHGDYKDRTGNLRSSNRYHADEDAVVLENTADYASCVESRGYDVLSGAFLNMAKELGI